MKILIPTIHNDIHAASVSLALTAKGHEVTLLYGADYPVSQHSSIHLSQDGVSCCRCIGPEIDIDGTVFDRVWYRRPTMPVLPDSLHSSDKRIARRSCEHFLRSFWQFVAPDAFWVNPLASRLKSTLKPVQLLEARSVGLRIPPTLFSNDPLEIRSFIEKHDSRTVYKTHYPAAWCYEGGIASTMTSSIAIEDLPEDDILCLSSGIFQERVEKSYEVRVNMMGDLIIAVKILSQENEETKLDWRVNQDLLKIEQLDQLPSEVEQSCKQLMRNLGLVFGCLDFIVTPEGEYVFLEVNENGQFLWIEEMDPEIYLLDPFCEFLLSGDVDIEWIPAADAARFLSFREGAIRQCERARETHQANVLQHLERD